MALGHPQHGDMQIDDISISMIFIVSMIFIESYNTLNPALILHGDRHHDR